MSEKRQLISPDVQEQSAAGLLSTKIRIPRLRPDLLARPHLFEKLEAATGYDLTLVSTPAGFGKTTLLSGWARSTQKKVAWFSLDQEDNDPIRFWRHLIMSIKQVRPGIGDQALALLHGAAQLASKSAVTAFVNEFAEDPGELVLILDDYHWIETDLIQKGMSFLLEYLPPGMHVVISSRSDPPLSLARLRARGQLAELRAADLSFGIEEIDSLLRKIWELNLSDESIAALAERTEGWVTGLQLSALSLRGASDPARFIQGFSGSHRYVLDYLAEEVLARQPEDIRRFLLDTSVLEQICGPLCDAVTGRKDGQKSLEALEKANLFLIPLDDERHWYRYHHLFADLLLARLLYTDPERAADLHRKASLWFEAEGLIGNAMRHGLAAGEDEWAARLVEKNVEELLRRGEGEMLRSWLAALPHRMVRSKPRLALVQAIAAFNAGNLRAAEPFLDEAEQAPTEALNEPYEPTISRELSMLTNIPASIALLRAALASLQGDAEATARLARSAQNYLVEGERGPGISIRWNLATASWMRGNLTEAEQGYAALAAEGRAAGELNLALSAEAFLGRVLCAHGRLEAAVRTYMEGLSFAARIGKADAALTGEIQIGLSVVLYERNLLEQALQHATLGISLSRQLTSTQYLAIGLSTLAWIRNAMGNLEGARAAMAEANQVMPDGRIVALHNPVPAQWAGLLLAQGDVQEVARWIEARRLSTEDEPSYPKELEYLVLARFMIIRGLPDQALTLLDRLFTQAKNQARNDSVIKIQILQALGLQSAGKADQSLKVLAQVLMLGESERYTRSFVDEGRPMAALLQRALSRGITRSYTASLLAAFPSVEQASITSTQPATTTKVEALSEREIEVLHLLAIGATNQEISERLSIALTTASKHVSNIFGKLGVNNRTQAVSRGRDLGLL